MSTHAILRDGQVVEVGLMEWARWFDNADRKVAHTQLSGSEVSTVFLGVNYQFNPNAKPCWFETMIFGGVFDNQSEHYETLEEAMQGHERMVAKVRDAATDAK